MDHRRQARAAPQRHQRRQPRAPPDALEPRRLRPPDRTRPPTPQRSKLTLRNTAPGLADRPLSRPDPYWSRAVLPFAGAVAASRLPTENGAFLGRVWPPKRTTVL